MKKKIFCLYFFIEKEARFFVYLVRLEFTFFLLNLYTWKYMIYAFASQLCFIRKNVGQHKSITVNQIFMRKLSNNYSTSLYIDSFGFFWSAERKFRSLFVVIYSCVWYLFSCFSPQHPLHFLLVAIGYAYASLPSIRSLTVTARWVLINAIFCKREIGCRTLIYQSTLSAVTFDFAEICSPTCVNIHKWMCTGIYLYLCIYVSV